MKSHEAELVAVRIFLNSETFSAGFQCYECMCKSQRLHKKVNKQSFVLGKKGKKL